MEYIWTNRGQSRGQNYVNYVNYSKLNNWGWRTKAKPIVVKPKLKTNIKTLVIYPLWNITFWDTIRSETIYSIAYLTDDCSLLTSKVNNRMSKHTFLCILAMDKTTTCFYTRPMADTGLVFLCSVQIWIFLTLPCVNL